MRALFFQMLPGDIAFAAGSTPTNSRTWVALRRKRFADGGAFRRRAYLEWTEERLMANEGHVQMRRRHTMALKAVVTGPIADPVLRWTTKQQAVLDLRMNATLSMRDKQTGQWENVGEPLWVSATFWDQEAQQLTDVLTKGDRVTVEGTLVFETYQRRDGTSGVRFTLRFPRFLGVIPRRTGSPYTGATPIVTEPAPAPEPNPWEMGPGMGGGGGAAPF